MRPDGASPFAASISADEGRALPVKRFIVGIHRAVDLLVIPLQHEGARRYALALIGVVV